MRKLFPISLLLLTISCTHTTENINFTNPLFNKTLYGMATKGDTIKITPNSYYIKNYYGYENFSKCELLKNKMDEVELKCLHLKNNNDNKKGLILVDTNNTQSSWIYKFVIPPKEQQVYKNGIRILLYPRLSKETEDNSLSYENYIIYTTEKN